MKILAGLGNPGLEYAWTRHNFGFVALDYLATTLNKKINEKGRNYLYLKCNISGESVILVKPQTFMNNSGIALKQVMEDYQIPLTDLIVLHDDIDIPLGCLRIKQKGQAGGHKGLISIIDHLQSSDFIRIRLGIGPKTEYILSLADYVTQPFTDNELAIVEETLEPSKKAIITLITEGINKAMTEFNRRTINYNQMEEE